MMCIRASPVVGFGRQWELTGTVVAWRVRTLLGAGFDAEQAAGLAVGTGVDLHELLMLVDRGCPARLAARILSPDEGLDE